jgi:hypothetical protein
VGGYKVTESGAFTEVQLADGVPALEKIFGSAEAVKGDPFEMVLLRHFGFQR